MRAKSVNSSMLPLYLRVDSQKVNGVVYTPPEIVRLILAEVGYAEEVLGGGWFLEPACGEGAFLEEGVRLLLEAAQAKGWSEQMMAQALESQIWGVDIDAAALRRAKDKLDTLAGAYGLRGIQWNLHQADALDPFWVARFRGRFRWVVGNPPYVRIQHLGEARRRFLQSHYQFCRKGSTDLYIAFFEAGIHLLEEGGFLGYITPNTYFYTRTAESFRNYLSKSGYLRKIIDFRDQQVFKSVTTYTAITILQKSPQPVKVVLAEGLSPQEGKPPTRMLGEVPAKALSPSGWMIAPPFIIQRVQEIERRGRPLGEIARIHVGITTLADELYIFQHPRWKGNLVQIQLRDGRRFWLEAELIRPIVKVSVLKSSDENQDRWLLFPYEQREGRYQLIPESRLKETYPLTYQYFLAVRERLLLRDKGKPNPYGWYAYGRHQGLDSTWGKKILVPPLAREPRFIVWEKPEYTYYAGYGIHYEGDLNGLASRLQSEDMALYLRYKARCYQNGYYSLAKSFIEPFGVDV